MRILWVSLFILYTEMGFPQSRWNLSTSDPNYMALKESHKRKKIKDCQEGKLHYKNRYSYPKKNKVDINSKMLGKCFLALYQEYHSDKQNYLENLNQGKDKYDQLFSYLAGDSSLTYQTGWEYELRDWVLSQKDNSILPHELFEKSLILNKGDLFASILTIHQLLRNEARFYASYIYYNSNWDRLQKFYNKFVDIRGDLEERCDGVSGGDHSGTWYRIWGTMLESINSVRPEENGCGPVSFQGETMCFVQGCFISSIAEIVKPLYMGEYSEIDPRKASINRVGYRVMNSFYTSFDKNIFPSENYYCDEKKYLE